jgi:hypothetical protein
MKNHASGDRYLIIFSNSFRMALCEALLSEDGGLDYAIKRDDKNVIVTRRKTYEVIKEDDKNVIVAPPNGQNQFVPIAAEQLYEE